jgi:hypothetical protein
MTKAYFNLTNKHFCHYIDSTIDLSTSVVKAVIPYAYQSSPNSHKDDVPTILSPPSNLPLQPCRSHSFQSPVKYYCSYGLLHSPISPARIPWIQGSSLPSSKASSQGRLTPRHWSFCSLPRREVEEVAAIVSNITVLYTGYKQAFNLRSGWEEDNLYRSIIYLSGESRCGLWNEQNIAKIRKGRIWAQLTNQRKHSID